MVARDLELVALTGARYHVAHCRRRASVRAGARGQAPRPAGHLRGDAAPPRRSPTRPAPTTTRAPSASRRCAPPPTWRRCARRSPTARSTRSPPITRRTRRSRRTSSSSRRRSGMIGLETALPLVLELVARRARSTPAALIARADRRPGARVRPAGRHARRRRASPTSRSSIPRRPLDARRRRAVASQVAQHAVRRAERLRGRAVLTVVGGTHRLRPRRRTLS